MLALVACVLSFGFLRLVDRKEGRDAREPVHTPHQGAGGRLAAARRTAGDAVRQATPWRAARSSWSRCCRRGALLPAAGLLAGGGVHQDSGDLFGSFGLWFSDPQLLDNLRKVLHLRRRHLSALDAQQRAVRGRRRGAGDPARGAPPATRWPSTASAGREAVFNVVLGRRADPRHRARPAAVPAVQQGRAWPTPTGPC